MGIKLSIMPKVKLFTADDPEILENTINAWLSKFPASSPEFHYSVSPYVYNSNTTPTDIPSPPKQMFSCMAIYRSY